MKKVLLVLFVVPLFFTSCKNDDSSSDMPDEANFYGLTVGNSWTYQVLKNNTQTEEYEELDLTITNTITGTEVIDGETFFIFEKSSQGGDVCSPCESELDNKRVRDSMGYLIDDAGRIYFTIQNSEPYLKDSFGYGDIYGELSQAVVFGTPIGEFFGVRINNVYAILENGETSTGIDQYAYGDIDSTPGLVGQTISTVNSPTPLFYMLLEDSSISSE